MADYLVATFMLLSFCAGWFGGIAITTWAWTRAMRRNGVKKGDYE